MRPRVEAPEAGVGQVGQARAEAIAEQAEQAEDHVAVGGGIGHDLVGLERRRGLLEQPIQDEEGVADGPRDDGAVEAEEMVQGVVEQRQAATRAEVYAVGSGVDCAHRHDEPQPVGGGDLAAAPQCCQRDGAVELDRPCVGAREGFRS